MNRDVTNNSHNYPPIVNKYFDRSHLDFIDLQEAVLISSAAIAEAEDFVSFIDWVFGPDGLPAL